MASNLDRLANLLVDSSKQGVSNFVGGAKSAFYSANPAGFSKISTGIEFLNRQFSETQSSQTKEKRERQAAERRQRGFVEESERNSRFALQEQINLLSSIDTNVSKILEILSRQDKMSFRDKKGSWIPLPIVLPDPEKSARGARAAQAAARGLSDAGRSARVLSSTLDDAARSARALSRVLPNFARAVRALPINVQRIGGPVVDSARRVGYSGPDDIDSRGRGPSRRPPIIIDGEFEDLTKGRRGTSGGIMDELLKPFRAIRERMLGLVGVIRSTLSGIGNDILALGDWIRSTKIGQVILNSGIYKALYTGFKGVVTSITSVLRVMFSRTFGWILSAAFGVYEGFFNDEALSEATKTAQEELGIKERISGVLGGAIGSFFDGVYFLVAKLTAWAFNLDYDKLYKDNERWWTTNVTQLFNWFINYAVEGINLLTSKMMGFTEGEDKANSNLAYLQAKVMVPLSLWWMEVENLFVRPLNDYLIWWNESVAPMITDVVQDVKKWWFEKVSYKLVEAIETAADTIYNFFFGILNGTIEWINNKIIEYAQKAGQYLPDGWADALIEGLIITPFEVEARDSTSALEEWRNASLDAIETKREEEKKEHTARIQLIKKESTALEEASAKAYREALIFLETLQKKSSIGQEELEFDRNKAAAASAGQGPATAGSAGSVESLPIFEDLNSLININDGIEPAIVTGTGATTSAVVDLDRVQRLQHEQLLEDEQRRHEEQSQIQMWIYGRLDEFIYRSLGNSELLLALYQDSRAGGNNAKTLWDNIRGVFGSDGSMSKVGDFFKNVFGGSGGKAPSWWTSLEKFGGEIKGIFEGIFSGGSGTNIFTTPGFGGGRIGQLFGGYQGSASGNPFVDMLGGWASGKLGTSGVGTNALYALSEDLFTAGTDFTNFKSAITGPGGFMGALGPIATIFGGETQTLGGQLSAGLAIYQLLKGGGASSMIGNAITQYAGRQALASGAVVGPYSLAGAGAQTIMGRFGLGMSEGLGAWGQYGTAGNMGAIAGAAGTAMLSYQIGELISGGYTTNKYLTKIAAAVSMIPGVGMIAGVIAGAINRLFGRKPKKYTDYGYDLTLGSTVSGQQYQDWVKKGGVYRSDKKGTEYSQLDSELLTFFEESVGEIQTSFGQMAEVMGLNADAIKAFSRSYSISLQGLSSQQAQQKIAELMVKYAEDAILATYGNVRAFSFDGETVIDTFERLATATETISYWFEALGYQVENTFWGLNEAMDLIGDATSNAAASMTGGASAVADEMASQLPTEDVMIEPEMYINYQYDRNGRGGGIWVDIPGVGRTWIDAASLALGVGAYGAYGGSYNYVTPAGPELQVAAGKSDFIESFGGQEAFNQAMGSYFNMFYTEEEKLAFQRNQAIKAAEEALAALDPEVSALIERVAGGGISQAEFDQMIADYRAEVDAAIEAGDTALAQELISGAQLFYEAAQLSMQAAEQLDETVNPETGVKLTAAELFGYDLTGTMIQQGFGTSVSSNDEVVLINADGTRIATESIASGTGTGPYTSVSGDNLTSDTYVNPLYNMISNSSSNQSVKIYSDAIRDYHPILSMDVRGVTGGFLGLGSR